MPDRVVIAPSGFEDVVADELGSRTERRLERLFLVRGTDEVLWTQNMWLNPKTFTFKSISEARDHLRKIQRSWWLHPIVHHRRAQLICDQLPPLKKKPIKFLAPVPNSPLGSWTLLDEHTLLYSAECTSPWPDGEVEFIENKIEPPSRAYLKLWELFTTLNLYPQKGERVLDLGSSPGGWTWVLDQLGCETITVDKAPLSKATSFSPRVKYISENAFGLKPTQFPGVSWLFSDVICYPERLLELILKWLSHVPNLVCTVKFQGATDFKIIQEFKSIPGSEMRHLSCNKHELTWWRIQPR